jgi:zinc protease
MKTAFTAPTAKKKCALLLVALAAACAMGSLAADSRQTPPKLVASVEGITEYQLDNGLRVLLFPDKSQSKVTVNMTVLVGSRQEGYGETGMAHLLEHMVFKGTPKHPKIPKELQEHGAQFNGSTSADRVNYFETLPANDENLQFAIDLEADRLVNSSIKAEDLASEMTVVRNEFEMGENSPSGVLSKRVTAAAYNWHNYGKPTIGNRADIEGVPVERLRAFYKKYYQPDNIVLIVAGRFDQSKALGLVQRSFGAIPRPVRKLETTYTEEPPQEGERSVTLRRVGDVAVVQAAYHVPAGPGEQMAALEVLANILSTQPSGRLYKALVETKKAVSAYASARRAHDPGLLIAEAEVSRDGSLEEVRELLLSTVETIGANGVTDDEVERAKRQILKARELAANDTSQIAVSLSEWAAQGDWRLYFLHRDRVERVTAEAVQAAAARFLQRDNRTVGLFIPSEKSEQVPIPPAPDVAALVSNYTGRAPIAEGEAFDATPEKIEARVLRRELPEGIKVTLLPKKSRGNEVHLLLTLRYGNEENLKGFQSAAPFLSELMLRGTRKLDYQQLRDELDRLNATLSAGGGGGRGRRGGRGGPQGASTYGAISFSIQAKRDTLPGVLEILRQVLREASLPADQFDVLKRERLAMMEQMRTEPQMLAPRMLERELNPYPTDDIRHVPAMDEAIERLRSVDYDQVAELYHDFLGSQAGELTIVGDFDYAACLPVLEKAFSDWTASKPYARIAMPVFGAVAGAEHVIQTPDKANATYIAGLMLPLRDDDADYPAMVLGNYILGAGALSSRLGNRIRQQDGLSYSVSSSVAVSSLDRRAEMTISAICNPKNIERVQKDVSEELERLLHQPIPREELEKAKQGYLEAEKVRRSSDSALAAILSNFSHFGRTMAYQGDLEKKIQALTPEQVSDALRRRLDPAKLVIVTAGDFPTKTAAAN